MKKSILSALAGAMAMFLLLVLIVNTQNKQETKYEHIDFISSITPEKCFVCSKQGPYWDKDNVGIVNLNTFEMMRLEINRYGNHGELIEESAGVMLSCGITDEEADTYAHAYCFPDNAYASIQITGVQYAIDREVIQTRLCQSCLNSINNLWFANQSPAEYVVISFADRTIQPLLSTHPWFAAGNFGVDCEFKNSGAIDLLVHYCPTRYK